MAERTPDQVSRTRRLVQISDTSCIGNLMMNRNSFARLCYLLEHVGGLVESRYVGIYEKVAMFLLYLILLVEPRPIPDDCMNNTWKWFKGCLVTLDGTYIPVKVPAIHKPRYRSRKGDITVNVLGVRESNQKFVYLLQGWEGSAADARVLRDSINIIPMTGAMDPDFLKTLKRNSIISIPKHVQNRIIMSCALIHKFIRNAMSTDPMGDEVDDFLANNPKEEHPVNTNKYTDFVENIEPSQIEIFGKDRATGVGAEDFTEAVNKVLHSEKHKEKEIGDDYEGFFDVFADETEPTSHFQQSSSSTKKSSGKKTNSINPNDPMVNMLGIFCDKTEARLGDIASQIEYEFDAYKVGK
ncbi:hypothetical protein BUALT_Bualt13G0061800 [Buddleja alternifolia]|uniref:DDE Tnp4 domain-containing protein n=1 Tax=Buddleja alternifolia TaxID=168488 RepID=A0AAV6WQL6_9LAMI|nr:hypothetical protein BUALT_Bualt13G0061800 [Buddleja alternifolia]